MNLPKITALPLFWCLLLAAAAWPSGCSSVQRNRADIAVESGGPLTPGAAYAVHVENRLGDVRIVVDPKAKTPRVTASTRGPDGRTVPARWAAAAVDPSPIAPILRVLASNPETAAARADLWIVIPACAGLTVRTSGGAVDLRGVAGAVEVDSGSEFAPGGPITVSFDSPVKSPLTLRSVSGPIRLDVPAGSRGVFDASAAQGRVRVLGADDAYSGTTTRDGVWKAVLNGGDTPAVVRAGSGDVTIRVRP